MTANVHKYKHDAQAGESARNYKHDAQASESACNGPTRLRFVLVCQLKGHGNDL